MRQQRAALALVLTAGLIGAVSPFVAAAAGDPGCTALGGTDGAGTCDVSAPVVVTGTISVGENLHLKTGAVLTVTPGPFTLNVTGNLEMDNGSKIDGSATTTDGDDLTVTVSGDMTMHGGAVITSATSDFGGTAGTITITVGNYPNIPPSGIFTMETGSTITANGGPSGTANDIVITAGDKAVVNGQVLSQVLSGLTGTGATQGRDGAAIFISTGCGLDVGGTVSSFGRDAGADLVHLQSCAVTISGFVQSSGQGHGVPNSPYNHCAHTFRPGKPDNATGCVEVWADFIKITNTGEIEADINKDGAGGANGSSWIDLFAWSKMTIDGRTGPTDRFAVHANSYSGSDTTPNTVTAKVINGSFSGGGKLLSASDSTGNGSAGGTVVLEAHGAVALDTGTVMAAGDNVGGGIGSPPPCDGGSGACGKGGTISVRSFNAGISWQNGVGDVNPDRQTSTNAGSIALTACTAITVTGTNFDDATPSQTTGTCGGAPTVASYVEFLHTLWAACGHATISGTKWNDLNGNHQRDPGDIGLAGWHILVTGPGGPYDLVTDSNGNWSVDVPGGIYVICEVLQSGWTQTYPTGGTNCAGGTLGYTVEVVSGGCCDNGRDSDHNDFGNYFVQKLITCKEDPNRAALLTRTVDTSEPLGGGGVTGDPANYWTVQAAYDAAKVSAQSEVIGMFSKTTENLVLDGSKSLTITQCESAQVTAADNALPVWKINTTGGAKLLIIGPDSVGGTIGWELVSGGHTLKSIRSNGASVAGVRVSSNSNSVSFNNIASSGIGLDILGSSNKFQSGTIGPNSAGGVHIGAGKTGNTVSGATIQDNGSYGVWVEGNSNTISSNRLYRNTVGIKVTGASNQIKSNAVETSTGDGIYVAGNSNTLQDNKVSKNGGNGINVFAGTGNILKSNASNNSGENAGFEFTRSVVVTNGGSNKADGTSIPSASKCSAFFTGAAATCE